MKHTPMQHRTRKHLRPSRSLLSALSALFTAFAAINGVPSAKAVTGTWQANPADQGVSVAITVDSAAWKVSPQLEEGDAVFIGVTPGVNLGTNFSYYYAVGIGSTPADFARFSQSPGAGTFAPSGAGSPLTVSKIPSWHKAGNWSSGTIPNGVDDIANIAANAGTPAILIDRDVTIGDLNVDTTLASAYLFNIASNLYLAPNLSLIASSRNGGPVSTLRFAKTSGTPTLTISGGNAVTLSEGKLSGNIPGNASAKLAVVGTQGLLIDNQNAVLAPAAVNSSTTVPATPVYAAGAVRFGYGLDWSRFSGDLILARGVFQPLAGGSLNNNLSSLPLASKLVLGTESNVARLEILGNGSSGPSSVRGLAGTSPNASIINTSGGGMLTFQVGSYGLASDYSNFAGNIGDASHVAAVASASALRFVKIGAGTQVLSGPNNMNASAANSVLVAVNGGKLSLGTTGAIGTVTDGQGAANVDSSVVFHNGELEISGLGVAAPRSQSFGGSLIMGTVTSTTAANPDDRQAAQSNSFNTLTVIADPGQPAQLTFGNLRPRNFLSGSNTQVLNGVTSLYRGTNLGSVPGPGVGSIMFTAAPTVAAGLSTSGSLTSISGNSLLGVPQAPVLRGALADTSPTGFGVGFATYDSTVGVRPLASSEKNVVTDGAGYDAAPTSDNIVLQLAADAAIAGHLSNTLELSNTSGSSRTVTNSTTALNPANGLLFSGTSPIVLTGGQVTVAGDNSSEDILVHSINSSPAGVTLQSAVSNPGLVSVPVAQNRQGWITFNGPGNIRVEGALTVGALGGIAFNGTGTTTIAGLITDATSLNFNQGTVKFDAGASWNGVPRLLVASEAKVDLNGVSGNATTNRFSDINVPINPAGITVMSAGGEITNSSATMADLFLSGSANGPGNQATSTSFYGKITGNINLIVDKSTYNATTLAYTYGTQAFANANTYTGSTQIRSGVVNLARGGLLPATTVVTLGTPDVAVNSTLSLGDGNGSTNGSVRQELAGLYATGLGVAAVINNGSNVSQLTLNIPEGVTNVYTGNLGIAPATNGANSNLFGLRKIGPGTFEPAGGINSYTGGTIVEGGTLRVASDAALGQIGPLTGFATSVDAPEAPMSAYANSIILNGGTLQVTTTADFVLNSKRGIGLGPVSGPAGGTGALNVDSGVTLNYGGVIASAGNGGVQTLVKTGAGVLSLNGASTFLGSTQVSAGALGGTGSLAGSVVVNSGGALAPGHNGIGTFTINGGLTLNAGAALTLELGAPGTSDKIVLGGALSATGTATVNLVDAGGLAVGAYTIVSGAAPLSTANLTVGSIPAGLMGTFSSVGNDIVLNVAIQSFSALELWRQSNFGSMLNSGNGADDADPDKDGIANLIEYATNSNPTIANASPISISTSGGVLSLTYNRIADTSLTYTVQGVNELTGTWTTVTAGNNPSTGASNVAGPVTVIDSSAVTNRRFLRLSVSY